MTPLARQPTRALRRRFEERINALFAFVAGNGYEGPEFNYDFNTIIGSTLEASWLGRDRELNISVIEGTGPIRKEDVRRNFVSANFIRESRVRNPNDFLSIDIFITREIPEIRRKLDRLERVECSIDDVLGQSLPIYAALLQKELFGVLIGAEWRDGYYTQRT